MRNGIVFTALAAVLLGVGSGVAGPAGDKKAEPAEKRKGTVAGVVTARGDTFLEVKADGEEKARKYTPRWVGGVPAKGGGFDKDIVKQISQLKVGSRVRIEWEFDERPRVIRIELLRAADGKQEK